MGSWRVKQWKKKTAADKPEIKSTQSQYLFPLDEATQLTLLQQLQSKEIDLKEMHQMAQKHKRMADLKAKFWHLTNVSDWKEATQKSLHMQLTELLSSSLKSMCQKLHLLSSQSTAPLPSAGRHKRNLLQVTSSHLHTRNNCVGSLIAPLKRTLLQI